MIYEGEVGFNLNYSRVDCMWGIAVYFSKNANYSDDYRFNCANGDRQFFLAEVLIRDTLDQGANKEFRNPPNKPDGTAYDSIRG